MNKNFCEVPFYQEETRRFIPLIAGFLIAFLMIFNFLSTNINSHFQNLEKNTLRFIVEIPNTDSLNVTNYLKQLPFINTAKVLDQDHVYHLLSYWIPDAELLSDLPFPTFIDIELKKPSDISVLEKTLKSISKDIQINDFSKWDQTFFKISKSIQNIVTFFCIGIFISVAILISLISKASISFHKNLLSTLRLLGVRPRHIASLFQTQALIVVFIGWIIGFLMFLFVIFFMKRNFINIIFETSIDIKTIAFSTIPSILTCLLSSFVSRWTVLRHLYNLEK